jgi:hypothetical protein
VHLTAQVDVSQGVRRQESSMPTPPIATDSAAELHEIVGDDSTATFEDDPKFIDSDPTGTASSENVEVQRDTDDTEDSEEEIDEEDDELEDEDDDLEEEEDDELADDEKDAGDLATAATLEASGLTSVRVDAAKAADEDDDAGDVDPGVDEDALDDDDLDTDRVADAALRMSALVAATSEPAVSL